MKESGIRISVVSYLNSKPFIRGLRNASFPQPVDIQLDIPSVCADKLANGSADIGLVPVAMLPSIPGHRIISNYCIGADGPVSSVLLLSQVPLEEIRTILLDYQSRTSVMLARVLAGNLWNIQPEWQQTEAGFESLIRDQTAAVIIGDRALQVHAKYPYVYDLSEEWKKMTGLPFVFACWVATKELEDEFIDDFNLALRNGLLDIDDIAQEEKSGFLTEEEVRHYLTENIRYDFSDKMKKAMDTFLSMALQIA